MKKPPPPSASLPSRLTPKPTEDAKDRPPSTWKTMLLLLLLPPGCGGLWGVSCFGNHNECVRHSLFFLRLFLISYAPPACLSTATATLPAPFSRSLLLQHIHPYTGKTTTPFSTPSVLAVVSLLLLLVVLLPIMASSSSAPTTSSGTNPFRDLALAQQQQEGLAAATSDPLRFYWLKQGVGAAWTPLRKRDSAALEAALAKAATASGGGENAEPPLSVLVEGGRYEVNVKERRLQAVYWDKDVRQVLRSSWFSKPATNLPGAGGFVPYGEGDAAAIEALYQGVLDETVRSLAAGSFLEASISSSSSSSSSSSGAAGVDGSCSHTTTTTTCSGGGGKNVLLRKELVLTDKIHKVVITVKDVASLSADGKQHRRGSTTSMGSGDGGSSSGGASCPPSSSAYAVKALPGVEIEMLQQRCSYGIGVLHNRVMRRGYVDETVAPAGTAASSHAATAAAGPPSSPLEVDEQEEDDDVDREPDHLVFVVHGIGEKLWSSDKIQGMLSLRASVEQLRVHALAQRVKHFETPFGASGAGPNAGETATATAAGGTTGEGAGKAKKPKKTRTEFLPIEWFDALRGDTASGEGDLMRRIQRVTLDTVPLFRQLANDCVLDVLLYMNPRYRQKIVTAVANRINAAYALFCQHHPGFHGKKKVSFIGHSLGSVVLFDLLAHQQTQDEEPLLLPSNAHIDFPQLAFPVDLFFTLGSPIGMFLCVREQELPPNFRFPTTSRFLNVFHPLDPIAYRLEPLLQPALSQLPPALVPHHEGSKTFVTKAREQKRLVSGSLSALSLSVSAGAKSLMGSLSSLATAKPAFALGGHQEMLSLGTSGSSEVGVAGMVPPMEDKEAVPNVAALRLNNGQRVDYALQELVSEQINEYVSSIAAHSCYFASLDVAYFVTKLVYDQPDKAAAGETEGTGVMDDGQEVMASDKAQEEAALAFSYEKVGKGERTFVI